MRRTILRNQEIYLECRPGHVVRLQRSDMSPVDLAHSRGSTTCEQNRGAAKRVGCVVRCRALVALIPQTRQLCVRTGSIY